MPLECIVLCLCCIAYVAATSSPDRVSSPLLSSPLLSSPLFESTKNQMSTQECWTAFQVANDRFVEIYIAYHYLRAKSWVPRSGLKFGSDFTLYRGSPEHSHAE
jgi:tRNA splicing endonuclease